MGFVDLTRAFDSVNRNTLWLVLERMGCPPGFLAITRWGVNSMMACVAPSFMVERDLKDSLFKLVQSKVVYKL